MPVGSIYSFFRMYNVKILALETTDLTGSVAASDGSNVLLELELNPRQRSAQSLAPAIKVPLATGGLATGRCATRGRDRRAGLVYRPSRRRDHRENLRLRRRGRNPGDRYARNDCCQASRDVLVPGFIEKLSNKDLSSQLEVILDAQRGEIVAGSFARSEDGWFRPIDKQRLISIDRWLAELRPGMAVTGPILKKLQSRIPPDIMVLEERFWHPRAAQVARLAARDYAAGRRDDLWTLLPRYSRRSAAEEKLEKA